MKRDCVGFKIDTNWRDVDTFDGKDLVDGDQIRIYWPDGTCTKHVLIVESDTYVTYDCGRRETAMRSIAYFDIHSVHDARIRCRLRDHTHLHISK